MAVVAWGSAMTLQHFAIPPEKSCGGHMRERPTFFVIRIEMMV